MERALQEKGQGFLIRSYQLCRGKSRDFNELWEHEFQEKLCLQSWQARLSSICRSNLGRIRIICTTLPSARRFFPSIFLCIKHNLQSWTCLQNRLKKWWRRAVPMQTWPEFISPEFSHGHERNLPGRDSRSSLRRNRHWDQDGRGGCAALTLQHGQCCSRPHRRRSLCEFSLFFRGYIGM